MVNSEFVRNVHVPSFVPPKSNLIPGEEELCYVTERALHNGVWQVINPLEAKVPIFILQIIIIITLTRLLLLSFKPLRQPPFVAEILAGILVGPSLLGRLWSKIPFLDGLFSTPNLATMETVGNLGLVYHLFFLGLEMDIKMMSRIGSRSIGIGIAGALFPFTIGAAFYYLLIPEYHKSFSLGSVYWGIALSVTGLPVIADILAKLKLIHSEVGRIAISSAFVSDIVSAVLLTISFSITNSKKNAIWSLSSAVLFILVSFLVIRPTLIWISSRKTNEGEDYGESKTCIILILVLASGLVTDLCGASSMVGAFVLGLIIPTEMLGERFFTVVQGFVSNLLMPLYYASVGMRFDLSQVVIHKNSELGRTAEFENLVIGMKSMWLPLVVVLFSYMPKLLSTVGAAYVCDIPADEGFILGTILNAKGLLAVIALNLGRDHNVINEQGFTIFMIAILVLTVVTSPITRMIYKPTKRFSPTKDRVLQKLRPDAELRMLACVHELHSINGMTKLLQISHATRRSPICFFVLQLFKLTKHTTSLLAVNTSSKASYLGPHHKIAFQNSHRADSQTDQLIAAFDNLECINHYISVHCETIMSDYATMHQDIRDFAEDKRVAFIILPYHKRQSIHHKMEETNPEYKLVNQNLLEHAPCSIGILVDRGFGQDLTTTEVEELDGRVINCNIAMIFLGGPDDREALTYASRMARHPKTILTVLRLIQGKKTGDSEEHYNSVEDERQLDDTFFHGFRYNTQDLESIVYIEEISNDGIETAAAIRSLGNQFDLYVVGRGMGISSPIMVGLENWSNDGMELGSIGDLLLTSDFSGNASVLIVQQYITRKNKMKVMSGYSTDGTSHGYQPSQSSVGKSSHGSSEPLMKHSETSKSY